MFELLCLTLASARPQSLGPDILQNDLGSWPLLVRPVPSPSLVYIYGRIL